MTVWDLWDNVKCTNIRIIGVTEEEEKKKGYEKIFEGSLPISSSFIWTSVFLVCFFISVVFLCLFIISF